MNNERGSVGTAFTAADFGNFTGTSAGDQYTGLELYVSIKAINGVPLSGAGKLQLKRQQIYDFYFFNPQAKFRKELERRNKSVLICHLSSCANWRTCELPGSPERLPVSPDR